MRIVHVVWSFTTGGIETMLVDIVNEQVKTCEVCLYIINDEYDPHLIQDINQKVKVVLIRRKPQSRNIFSLLKFNALIWSFNPDIIHCHQANLARAIWLPYKKVLTIHNTHSNSKFLGNYNRLFCISKAVRDYIAQQGFPNGIVVYNGIHTSDIAVKDHLETFGSKAFKIVCVGRLHPDKGQQLIVEAMNELVNKHHIASVSCDIIGDGSKRSELEVSILSYKLSNNIHLLGNKPRSWLYQHLKDYDLYVLPSISEGFGLSLAEACAAKLPVLTCDLAGPMEVIDEGRFGKSFKTGDVLSLAEGIESFSYEGINYEQVENAYKYVRLKFDVRHTAQNYIKEYVETLLLMR